MKSEFDNINFRLNNQVIFFSKISELDEEKLTSDQLFAKVLYIFLKYWITADIVAINIQYQGKEYSEGEFSSDGIELTTLVSETDSHNLRIKFEQSSEDSNPETDQQVLDAITLIIATKLKRIEAIQNLKEKQKFLDKAYKLARIGTWEYDMINDELHWSDITKEVHGFDSDYQPDVENTVLLFKEGFHRDTFARTVEDAIERFKPFDVELKIISGKGDERWIRATGEPEFNEEGICTRFYGISQNVTNRKQSAEDLQLSERRFRALVQDGSDLIAIVDSKGVYKYVSPTSMTILGISADDIIGQSALEYIHNEDKERVFGSLIGLEYKESVYVKPYRFMDADSNWRWIETTLTNLSDDPAVNGYVANSRDVTEQYLRQQQMEGSLREKETLLTEIHHRINNNLTVLTSMLQLQSNNENNQEVIDRLADSVTRVHAMANIHEQLYQSQNFSKLEISDRIKLLVFNIQNTFQIDTEIEIEFECDKVFLDVDKALPVSLIINEVITNIFKYAFKGRKKGEVMIQLREKNELLYLTVKDNGTGLPEDFNAYKSNSLGLTLIKSLSGQLDAEYQYISDSNGTEFILNFAK